MVNRKCTFSECIENTVCVTFGNFIDSIPIDFEIEIEIKVLKSANQ